MTPGLKFSFAARAAKSSARRSSSLQWIRRRARSREMGEPGFRSASSLAHDELCSGRGVLMEVRVTMLGSASCGCIESYNSGHWLLGAIAVFRQPTTQGSVRFVDPESVDCPTINQDHAR